MDTPPSFSAMFSKETNFVTSCLLALRTKSSQNGSTLKGKNWLRWEQIFFFHMLTPIEMGGKMKMTELLPLKVYLFTF